MCGLFGFYNYSGKFIPNLNDLTNSLAKQSTIRGKDATGIAYNINDNIIIHKEPKPAYNVNLQHPNNITCITGHTRHATHGDKKFNYNNHPFSGTSGDTKFALCHNGILTNYEQLKKEYNLPKTEIKTDSYIATQILEKQNKLDIDNIKFMSETIMGCFTFTILDNTNNLWIICGDDGSEECTISLIHFPKYKLYVYASTDDILFKAINNIELSREITNGNFEKIIINKGNIINISSNGEIVLDTFKYNKYSGKYHWWNFPKKEVEYMENCTEFNVKFTIKDRWINQFMSFLDYLEYCSHVGHSAPVGFYADGDGDFRFEFDTDVVYEKKYDPDEIDQSGFCGKEVEVLFDAR